MMDRQKWSYIILNDLQHGLHDSRICFCMTLLSPVIMELAKQKMLLEEFQEIICSR